LVISDFLKLNNVIKYINGQVVCCMRPTLKDRDQDQRNSVLSALETKSAVSRTATLLL